MQDDDIREFLVAAKAAYKLLDEIRRYEITAWSGRTLEVLPGLRETIKKLESKLVSK